MRTHRPGHSLPELTIILILLGIMTGMAVPAGRATLDRIAVAGACHAVASALAVTRASARVHGGASLVIDARAGTLGIVGSDGAALLTTIPVSARHGVSLEVGAVDTVHIRYDALGIGRLANRTVRIRRGAAEAVLAISAYGRWRSC
jgi:Tfp pilus assembly protein FimT